MHSTQLDPSSQNPLSGVSNIIAVASAKGGVGKSTVCVNLATSLTAIGLRVGVLDGDIYGPSIPLMMGTRAQPAVTAENRIVPVVHQGIAIISVGLMTGEETPVIWRGPLLAQAMQQFLSQVDWGELDFLIVDLPPGTGDIPLTLSQHIELSGAVIVTTPQDVALSDVERGIAMFQRVEVDVVGLVENMSHFVCPHCDVRHELFGASGGERLASRLGIPLLGRLPLVAGEQQAAVELGRLHSVEFEGIARRLISEIDATD